MLLAVALPAGAAMLARTRVGREYIGREVSAALRRELGLHARIAEIEVDPSSLSVIARGLHLMHPDQGAFASANSLRIRPSFGALLRGQLDLHEIELERPTVWLKVRDGKIVNLPDLPDAGPTKPGAIKLPFDFLDVEQARLIVDADPLLNGELLNIEVHINGTGSGLALVRLAAAGGHVRHAGGRDAIQRVELSGAISEQDLGISKLLVESPALRVAVRDAQVAFPLGSRYQGHIELGLHVPQLLRWPLGVTLPPLEGELGVTADVKGDREGPRGSAQVSIARGMAKQFGFGEHVALDLRFDPEQVAFKGLARLIRDGGSVLLDGKLLLGQPGLPLELRGDVQDVSFAKLMEQLGVSPNAIVDWTIAGGFELKGPTAPLALAGTLRMPTRDFKVLQHAYHAPPPERRILGVSSAKLNGDVRVDNVGIHLIDIGIELPDSRLNADVLLGFDNELRVNARGLDWALVDASPLLQFELGGRSVFELEIDGTFSDPVIRGHMNAREFAFGGFVFGDVDTDFEVDRDLMGVRFARMNARKNESRYALVHGFLDFRKSAFRAAGELAIESLALADFYRIFHYEGDERYEPYQGKVHGTANIDYTMDYPGDGKNGTMVTDIDVAIDDAVLDGYAFADGNFSGRWKWLDHEQGYRGGELTIERLSLQKGNGTVNVSGRMNLNGALDLVLVGDKLAIRSLEGLSERAPELGGNLAVSGVVRGDAAIPRADLELTATGLTLRGEPLGDGRAYVRLTDKDDPWIAQALQWPEGAPPKGAECGHAREGLARGRWPEDAPFKTAEGPLPRLDKPMAWVICGSALGGQLRADLAIGRTEVYPARGQLLLDKLAFGDLLPRARARTPMFGHVSGAITLRGGALMQPETLVGEAVLSELSAGQLDVELRNDGPIDLRFGDGAFEVRRARLAGPSSRLEIAGGGSLRDGLQLAVDGEVDVGLLTSLSQTVAEASGKIALRFKITGLLAAPTIYGEAQLRGASLQVASFPEAVRDVSGKVTFTARRAVLEGFSAKVAGGTVSWGGAAELQGRSIGSYSLQVEARGLTLRPRDGVDLQIGGRGELSWKQGQRLPLLSGRLRLDQLVYARPIKMDRTLGEMYGPERAEVSEYDPANDLLAIDIMVQQTRPLFVRNNLIDAELRLENDKLPFRLVGTDQRFGVVGNMSVRKGTVRFRDRAFDIRQGDIHFDDETRIDPNFDLRATTEVRRSAGQQDWRIEIHAFGNRDQFRFELSSEPALAEDDIALLLTVGMTQSEMAQLEASDLTSTAALEALASVTGVESEVHRALPQIDDFQIASQYSERTNRTEPQLSIGKRIAENVRLRASTGIAESREFSTGVELQLDDKTSVQAVYNNQNASSASQVGDVGVDLKWRLEFD